MGSVVVCNRLYGVVMDSSPARKGLSVSATKYAVGQEITLVEDRIPWYSGYGTNPHHILRAGEVGTITHTNVPAVRGRGTYAVARFGDWQTDLR